MEKQDVIHSLSTSHLRAACEILVIFVYTIRSLFGLFSFLFWCVNFVIFICDLSLNSSEVLYHRFEFDCNFLIVFYFLLPYSLQLTISDSIYRYFMFLLLFLVEACNFTLLISCYSLHTYCNIINSHAFLFFRFFFIIKN